MVLPSAIVSHIGGFLRLSQTDQDLLVDDDEFIAGDESESENECSDIEPDTIEKEETKKICSCSVCDLMNGIKDKWKYYNPPDEMGKIFKKHIDNIE